MYVIVFPATRYAYDPFRGLSLALAEYSVLIPIMTPRAFSAAHLLSAVYRRAACLPGAWLPGVSAARSRDGQAFAQRGEYVGQFRCDRRGIVCGAYCVLVEFYRGVRGELRNMNCGDSMSLPQFLRTRYGRVAATHIGDTAIMGRF